MLGDIDTHKLRVSAWGPKVYTGHDNILKFRFEQYDDTTRRDKPLDFSAVSRMVLRFPEVDPVIEFDTDVVPDAIDWVTQGSSGVLFFDLSAYIVDVGTYNADLVVYDAEHARGQVLVSTAMLRDAFNFTFERVGATGLLPPLFPSGDDVVIRRAGETISALRGVYELDGRVYKLDQQDSLHIDYFLGITISSASSGREIVVKRSGTIDDASWNWTPGLVYLGTDGMLTQTVPTTGWEMVVGNSPSPQRLNIDFDEPVLLAQEQ